LLLMSNNPTVIRLIPSRVLKKVFVIVTLAAFDTNEGKVSCDRAGSAAQLIVPTWVNSLNLRVDNRVKLNIVNEPDDVAIEPMVLLVRSVNCPALLTSRLPEIADGPSKAKTPDAFGPTRTLPAMVSQSEIAVASA